MTTTAERPAAAIPSGHKGFWLWDRKLYRYPKPPVRYSLLALAVLSTIVLYIQLYALGGVSTLLSQELGISFIFLVTMLAITNLIGAFGSLAAGLGDRFGRANMVIWGLLVIGILTAFVAPAVTDKYMLAVVLCVIGFIEGMLLVATPALVRDYSPQVGRAAAMGIWNVGPVAGSLIVAIVASATLQHFDNSWTSQFVIAGIIGLVMFVIALLFLKELSPELRDQLMVDTKDSDLVEARASRGQVEANLAHPFKQLLHADIIWPAIGFGTLLLLYFTLVGFSPVLYATGFGFNASDANGIAAWAWGANVVVTLLVGFFFDWSKVRKPWMILGGILTIVFELVLLFNMHNALSFTQLSLIMAFMSGSFGFAAVAFYAAFTETIEARNPALTATGLAIWGWIIRIVATVSFLVIPYVVTSATTLLENAGKPATPEVARAAANVASEWQVWLWICVAGVIVFMLVTPLLRGPWSPRKARELLTQHNREVAVELAKLRAGSGRQPGFGDDRIPDV